MKRRGEVQKSIEFFEPDNFKSTKKNVFQLYLLYRFKYYSSSSSNELKIETSVVKLIIKKTGKY